jgi:Cu+-exporting ATPase
VSESFELVVGGMSCAACAARIEKKLGKIEGVRAAVNYATERAYVAASGGHAPQELIAVIEAAGYSAALPPRAGEPDAGDAERAAHLRMLVMRLAVCIPPALAVIVLAMVPRAQFAGWQWVSMVLTLPVAAWGAWPLHRGAWLSLRQAAATMDTLVSLGIAASCSWSLYAVVWGGAGRVGMRMMGLDLGFTAASGGDALYWDAAAGVTIAVLAGRVLEARAKTRAGSALAAMDALAAGTASVLRDGVEHVVPVEQLRVGDVFVVRPGERVATDGVVVEGASAVDVAMLTGESIPVEAAAGDEVVGGSLNVGGRLIVRAARVGADTRLAALTRLVAEALGGKAAVQHVADRVAGVFVPCVIAASAAVFGFWLGAGVGLAGAAGTAVAVLVVACPCALGLATPTALLVGIGRGAELGIVIKGAQVLESTRRVDTIVFDKTGTLTTGVMGLTAVVCDDGDGGGRTGAAAQALVLALAGAVEQASEHPVGRAVAKAALAGAALAGAAAARPGIGGLAPVTDFTALPGAGVRGRVGERVVTVGRPGLFDQDAIAVPSSLQAALERAEDEGRTAVLVGWGGRARGVLVLADEVKPSAPAAITRMRRLGLRPVLLTGDNARVARTVAARLGIEESDVLAGVPPEGKVAAVERLQAQGRVVAVVGDGVNDAAALARADLGMAMGTGTDVAIAAGDVTLASGDPWAAADAIALARATLGTIRANLAWAFGYNLLALPAAALGYLNPMFAGVAMAASSLLVVSNSLRLRAFRRDSGGHLGPIAAAVAAAAAAGPGAARARVPAQNAGESPVRPTAARRRPSRLG